MNAGTAGEEDMKRFALTAVSALIFTMICLPAGAQTVEQLVGRWTTVYEDNDEDMKMKATSTYTFNADGSLVEEGVCELVLMFDEKTSIPVTISFHGEGNYTLSGDVISYVFNPKAVVVEEEGGKVPGLLRMLLINPLKSEMKKSVKKPSSDRILEFAPGKMTLLTIGDKDAEKEVYIKEM